MKAICYNPHTHYGLCLVSLTPLRRLLWLLLLLPLSVMANTSDGIIKWQFPHKPNTLPSPQSNLPFYPSRAQTGGNPLSPEMFEDPAICQGCHPVIYQQWKGSNMANSWDDPIYKSLFKRASKATNGGIDNFCIACHSPIGMTSMKLTGADIDSERQIPGITCDVCHNIGAITGHDNAAYVLTPDRDKHIKLGPHTDASSPYHQTAYSDLHTRSEICATCHNVTHPFNSTPIERTYDEWQESVYNEQGIQCQDCHMTPGPGATSNPGKSAIMGKERKHVYSHDFSGGNSTLHEYFGAKESAELARAMLRSAAKMEFIELPEAVTVGDTVTIKIKVTNIGAGHKLPTGFPEGREVWVDFKATSDHQQVYRSGEVIDGHTEKNTRNFKVWLGDANGNVVDLNVWEVDRVLADTRIPPKGFAIVDYTFVVPANAGDQLILDATLNYWPFSQHLIDELLGAGQLDVDIVEMTTTQAKIDILAPPLNAFVTPSH